jgi:hypothetical protein
MGTNRILLLKRLMAPLSLVLLLALALMPPLFFPAGLGAADQPVSQCVACHTDAARLRALTPPDPPPSEEGEG